MPAHQMDLQGYARFLTAAAEDPRFNSEHAHRRDPQSRSRLLVVGPADLPPAWSIASDKKRRAGALAAQNAWFDKRPPQGPGRVDTFNPYKRLLGFDMNAGQHGRHGRPAVALEPAGPRAGCGCTGTATTTRSRSGTRAPRSAPARRRSRWTSPSLRRIEDWILDLRPPAFPAGSICSRRSSSAAGRSIRQPCASVTTWAAHGVGQVVEIGEIKTDPERLALVHAGAGAVRMNTIGDRLPVAVHPLPQDQRLLEHAARRHLAARAVPAQRIGADAARADVPRRAAARSSIRGYDVYDWDKRRLRVHRSGSGEGTA